MRYTDVLECNSKSVDSEKLYCLGKEYSKGAAQDLLPIQANPNSKTLKPAAWFPLHKRNAGCSH
jgi:hypothetical protein